MKKHKENDLDFEDEDLDEELDKEELDEYDEIRAEQERLFWTATAFDKGKTLFKMLLGKKF